MSIRNFDQEEVNGLDDEIITFVDENGEEFHMEFLDLVDYQDKDYAVLLPCDDDDGEVVILEVVGVNEDDLEYISVEDDAVLQAVFAIFKEQNRDKFNFEI